MIMIKYLKREERERKRMKEWERDEFQGMRGKEGKIGGERGVITEIERGKEEEWERLNELKGVRENDRKEAIKDEKERY